MLLGEDGVCIEFGAFGGGRPEGKVSAPLGGGIIIGSLDEGARLGLEGDASTLLVGGCALDDPAGDTPEAVPVSPLDETSGPRGTPLGAAPG